MLTALLVLEDGRTFRGEAFGAVGESVRRGGVRHRDDRLPGDADRPVVPPAGRGDDRAAHRQHRDQRRGRRVRPDLGRRLRGARPGPAPVVLAVAPVAARTSWRRTAWSGCPASDTRALTRHLRERGAMRVGVSSVDERPGGAAGPGAATRRGMPAPTWPHEVSTPRAVRGAGGRAEAAVVAALDLGIKRDDADLLAGAASRRTCCRPGRPPRTCSALEPGRGVRQQRAGRPGHRRRPGRAVRRRAGRGRAGLRDLLRQPDPRPGARASARTSCGYGHRGINQPVRDRATGRVEVTAHNHGFAVDAPPESAGTTRVRPGRRSATSASTTAWWRACAAWTGPAFSVQYHPEAAAGPHDAAYLFDRFVSLSRWQSERQR